MEEMIKNNFSGKMRKNITSRLFGVLLIIVYVIGLVKWADATVSGNLGHTLSGANNNFINLSNSGAYQVNYSLSGTLDISDTIRLTANDGSGNTLSGSFVSLSGGESSGFLLMDFSNSFVEGLISFTAVVYTGGIANQVSASGMTLVATLDKYPPIVSLIGSGTMTVAQGGIYYESGAIWTDTLDGSGTLLVANSGSVNTATIGSYLLQYRKTDISGNSSSTISRTVNVVSTLDTTVPIVSVSSHASGAVVVGIPTLFGLVSDTGGVANVRVNGNLATLGSGTWSIVLPSLVPGSNNLSIVATDVSGNTGSTSVVLNRVSSTSNINSTLSGSNSVIVTFSTDLFGTGIIHYGTNPGILNLSITGSSPGTTHTSLLTGLAGNTNYYFTVQGQGGLVSAIQEFKTPSALSNVFSGSITITGPIYLSGSSLTGVTFSGSGNIGLLSVTSNGSSLTFPTNSLKILASGGNWNGIIQPPEMTSYSVGMLVPGYGFTGTAYQIGNPYTELVFSGQLATVSVRLGGALSGQTIKVFRSINQGVTYIDYSTCVVTLGGDCIFTTNQLSLFAFAMPADTVPNIFSFSSLTNAELSTQYTSNTIVVSGITTQTAISVSGGEYSINGASFTTLSGVVQLGDSIMLRSLSSPSYGTSNNTTLTIGGITGILSITTKSAPSGGGGGGGGNGGGGGGGGAMPADVCIGGDFSPTYYDRLCMATAGNIITGIVAGSFNIPAVFINNIADVNFRDINGDWARDYILRLVTRGIIDNSNFYRGDDGLTRAEFLKIVIRTTGWELPLSNTSLPFKDIVMNGWYEPYVSLALSRGLIRNAQYFRPHDSITRAEATKILMIALGVTVSEPSTMTFIDVNKNSDLAKYIEAAKFLNILSGQMRNGKRIFRPNDSITRSEIAKVVANAFGL